MSVTIPLRNDVPHYSLEVELDGRLFTLTFLWNVANLSWYMSIDDSDGNRVASGIRLVDGLPLGGRLKDSRMPAGRLVMQDTVGQNKDAFFSDLGTRCLLLYYSAAEIEAIVNG